MKFWSRHWVSSKNPRKQRKYIYNAPLSVKKKFLSAPLSKELRQKYGKRSLPVKKGDEVEILRGEFKKRKGKISRVNLKKTKIYIEGVTRKKVDGTDVSVPIHPSNVRVLELDLKDEKRVKALNRKKEIKDGKKASKEVVSSKVLEAEKKGNKIRGKAKARSSQDK